MNCVKKIVLQVNTYEIMKKVVINLLNLLCQTLHLGSLQNEAFGEPEMLRRQGVLIPVFIKKDRPLQR